METVLNRMSMKKLFLLISILVISIPLSAQSKYWILFTDKANYHEQEVALSPMALEKRVQQRLALDIHDYSIHPAYIQAVKELGITISQQSRWLNAISAKLSPLQLEQVSALPFVQNIRPVAVTHLSSITSCDPSADYDTHLAQLSQLGLDDLHAQGFRGEGIRIAVLDNGFAGVDTIPAFRHIWERDGFLHEEDFVEKGTSIYGRCRGSCKHGTRVLSILAAKWPRKLIGAAPEADYMLFRTENDLSETHQEEDNWLAAAEKADSLGADIILSALTYKDFDLGEGDYTDSDLDGKTALVTIAAEIAASKGILVVNSAGNDGLNGISPPADGPSILAVGSVSQEGKLSSFSGRGPTYDGRTKPDLVARGDQTYLLHSDGSLNKGSGTSYAAPLVAGLAACLWQAEGKQTAASQLAQTLRSSGDRASDPDNEYGFGIPQAKIAYESLTGESLICVPSAGSWGEDIAKIYPNPSQGAFQLALQGLKDGQELVISILDLWGRKVFETEHSFRSTYDLVHIPLHINPGHYLIRVQTNAGGFLFAGKVVIRE